jgi:hypothetical protein
MKSQFKVSVLIFAFLISGQAAASADFSDEFAPSKWTYTETDTSAYGPSGTLTSSTMTISSANYTTWTGAANKLTAVVTTLASPAVQNGIGTYSIVIPQNTGNVTFDYSYYTGDIDSSIYDNPTYTINGVQKDLLTSSVGSKATGTGSVSLNFTGLAGTTFKINQNCSDCVWGGATTTITKFVAKFNTFSNLNVLSPDSGPAVTSDANGYICTPGSYSLLSRGVNKVAGKPTSLAYTLIVDGVRVSSVSSDNWGLISQSSVAATNNSVTGSATLTSATWAYKGANLKSARCEVVALQDGVTSLSGSK